jgi:lipopolysaccharide/colanic/teichoic acid biosynthesis glycosyltransferase
MSIVTAPVQETIIIHHSYQRAKRVVDIIFTLLILFPLLLITMIIALLIKLDSAGPVFFRQKRVGQNGVEFDILKFRSMYVDTDDSSHREAIVKYMNGQKLVESTSDKISYKVVDDPRVTNLGRFLRKYSFDELPQFFNILRGDMTLVGPRPPLPYEVDIYSSHDRLRLCGKPGLTGPWQVYGRSLIPFQEMVEMDIAYLRRSSIKEDLKLIILTVPVMIMGSGGA